LEILALLLIFKTHYRKIAGSVTDQSKKALNNTRRVYERSFVLSLFDSIAYRYDFLNHFLSSGVDILWRKRAIRLLQPFHPKRILDVATGTADFAIEAIFLDPTHIIGIDISPKMLDIGRAKILARKLGKIITLELGEAEHLSDSAKSFDAVIVAFGVRNFENLERSLMEFHRVLKIDGVALILEFSRPKHFPVKQFYELYSRTILPIIGGLISRNRSAYEYLPNTVAEFPDGEDFCAILRSVGFNTVHWFPQTFGIASIYLAMKE
jgi:demethylmenaquinone methyltransferase / 2-methoxy-6-polyprenyl-1,4-benzoquinol methylase